MPLTESERKALRSRCTSIVPGFRRVTPAEEFRALAAWCEAHDVQPDHYGDGALVAEFEREIAAVLGKAAAVFMPSGIMAQLAALGIWCERAKLDRFGMHPTSHLASYEEEAYVALMRLHGVPLGDRLRPMVAADLERTRQSMACVIVELPIREAGGRLPSWDELEALKASARLRGTPLHMDGARLWECAAWYRRSHSEIADGFDSVYVSLYKGVGAFAGAMLAGDDDFIANARLWRRRMGGTLFDLNPLVAPAVMRFGERIARMPTLYERTLRFAASLAKIPRLRVSPSPPQTNMLHLHFDADADAVLNARDAVAERTGCWLLGHASASEVPGWSRTEIYVGDQLLEIADDRIEALYAELLAEIAAVPATAGS